MPRRRGAIWGYGEENIEFLGQVGEQAVGPVAFDLGVVEHPP